MEKRPFHENVDLFLRWMLELWGAAFRNNLLISRKPFLRQPTMHHYPTVLLIALCLPLPLFVGCHDNPLDRQAVSGRVTFDSRPLDHGSIQLCPELAQGGIFAGALIVDGKYNVLCDKGLPPGKYKVEISAAIPGSNAAPKGPPGQSMSGELQSLESWAYKGKQSS
jgi:hypothetical protein